MAHFIEIFIELNVKQPMLKKGIEPTAKAMLEYATEQLKTAMGIDDVVNWTAAVQILKNNLKNQ